MVPDSICTSSPAGCILTSLKQVRPKANTGMKTPNPETPSILGFLESLGLGDMVDINPALPTIRYIPSFP